ncbi:MAG: hypothetical protein M3Y33_13530 [Actinomycetota bacterium]|nr:hypothetical protein [Actinomycetota bacterium]
MEGLADQEYEHDIDHSDQENDQGGPRHERGEDPVGAHDLKTAPHPGRLLRDRVLLRGWERPMMGTMT